MDRYFKTYCDKLEELRDIIISDLGPASPERGYIETDLIEDAWKSQSEKCNVITRYIEDDKYARAYCCGPYSEGIMIIFDKSVCSYNIIVIGEDDGVWFPSDYYYGTVTTKENFIYLLTEAISIFNSNFDSTFYDF